MGGKSVCVFVGVRDRVLELMGLWEEGRGGVCIKRDC